MMARIATGGALAALLSAAPLWAETEQPYAGQQDRAIASLSEDDVAALLAGEGWGLARPAELNGYPGPAHILELADELDLTEAQRAEVRAAFDAMQAEARTIGADYVDAEAHLSRMFAAGHANPGMVDTLLDQSSDALARLRAVHLKAHLTVAPILTDAQKAIYAEARGYTDTGGGQGHSGHGSH